MIERVRLATARLQASPVLPESSLLSTESRDEFMRMSGALNEEIRPRGIIEQIFVRDIAEIHWEILRLRRCKVAIIDTELRPALANLLDRLSRQPGDPQQGNWLRSISIEAENLAKRWFTDEKAKKQVSALLYQFHLDESAIEAEAIRKSAADLEKIDRMLASLESRRNRALGHIAEYREVFGRRLRESSDRIIDGKATAIEYKVSKDQSPAA